MSPCATTPYDATSGAPPRHGRARGSWCLLLTVLLLVPGLLTQVRTPAAAAVAAPAVPAAPASASSAPDRLHRWAGYRIPRNGRADGRWIGGYRVGRTPVFMVTPTRRPTRDGFRPVSVVADLDRAAGASPGETAQAAWVLSKYGGYRDARQAAAVDAAVYDLLAGGRWRIDHARGAARIRHSGDPTSVRRLARIMLAQARRYAGSYGATMTATGADLGGTVEATVRVTTGHGHPAAGLPVTMSGLGTTVAAVTGDDGRAVARFPATQAGWQGVTAAIGQVPEHRLYLRRPVERGQATAAEGGVKRTVAVSTSAAVRGPQTVSLQAAPDSLVVDSPAAVTAAVAGDGSPRTATAALVGPFASASAAVCSGPTAGTTSATVSADGSYRLPTVTPTAGGFYAWRVTVDGTATSTAVAACGAVSRVRARTTTTTAGPATSSTGATVTVQVTIAGVPFQRSVTGSVTLYGPYASDAERQADQCGTIAAGPVAFTHAPGNGTFLAPGVSVPGSGLYAWRASTNPDDLWLGSSSACLAAGTVMSVP